MTYVPTPTTDTPEITAFLESWVGALRARDAGAYAACYTDDVRVFDGMNPPQHRGIASWREMISTWFSGVGTEPDLVLKDVEVEVEGDLAVVTALAGYWNVPDGETERQGAWCRQTSVLRRTPDGWRICHEHSSVPFIAETGEADFTIAP